MDIDVLRTRLDEERKTNRLQQSAIGKLEDQVQSLNTRLGQVQGELSWTRQQLADTENEKKSLQRQLQEVRATPEETGELKQFQEIAHSTTLENQELRDMVKSLGDINQGLVEESEELKYQLNDRCSTITNLNRLIDIQSNQIKDLNNQHTQQFQENKQLNRLWGSNSKRNASSQKLFAPKNTHLVQQSISPMLSKNDEDKLPYNDYDDDDFVMDPRTAIEHSRRKGKARDNGEQFQLDTPVSFGRSSQKRKADVSPPLLPTRVPVTTAAAAAKKSEPTLVYIDSWSLDSHEMEPISIKHEASLHEDEPPLLPQEEEVSLLQQEEENAPLLQKEKNAAAMKQEEQSPPLKNQRQALKVVPTNIKNLASKVQAEVKHNHDGGKGTCNACEKFYGTDTMPDPRNRNNMITPADRQSNHSRHRPREKTPPGFWELTFPTQSTT
ncbi:hypothetical protein INT47_010964 [Mucor saturninus]|uniref:DNA endonuclease activator Ctp1 C-terminal domain-containing protein n=1 Tax=Mucor saturninus TaxID=64648 RepID=A0A8H7V5J8_9FUNG|nr:hypothetical protein INT47_010964 [Mucor saturninus]